MRHLSGPRVVMLLALTALACASASELTRRSQRDLAAGNTDKAFDEARQATEKQPGDAGARAALTSAGTLIDSRVKARVLQIAAADTIAAALELDPVAELRADLAQHGVYLPLDPTFTRQETTIREGAARIGYARGMQAMKDGSPKLAWAAFKGTEKFVPDYRDVRKRIQDAYDLARVRVAILPFLNQTDVPGLSQEATARVYAEVLPHAQAAGLQFTEIVPRERVFSGVTLAQAEEMSTDEAVKLGRTLGADQVVLGRLSGMHTSTNSFEYRETIYRKYVDKDTSGKTRERWVERPFFAMQRERSITVRCDVRVVDTRTRSEVDKHSETIETMARSVYTDYQADGDCGDYYLVSPEFRRANKARADAIDVEWTDHFGKWALSAFLERARKDRNRTKYAPGFRREFLANMRERPVFLGDLPDENEMAFIAIDGVWQPVFGMLKDLDAK